MGRQVLWVALIVACHLSAVYTVSIANTETAVSIGGSVEPHQKELHAGTQMKYDDYWYRTTPRPQYRFYTYYSPLFWILVSLPIVFLVGSLILGAVLFFCKDTKPKLGFVVNSNGATQGNALLQSRITQPVQPAHSSISLTKPGYVVDNNGASQNAQPVQPAHSSISLTKPGYVVDNNGASQNAQLVQPVFNAHVQPNQGYVVDSNGSAQQSQIAMPVRPAQKLFSQTKQGFVVSSNAGGNGADQSRNVTAQQAQNPDFKPMYPEVKSVQKY